MEELTVSRNRNRGQLILVGAISLAVVFLALGVITNAAIFTQNLATRGDTAGSGNALTVRHQIHDTTAEAMADVATTDGSPGRASLAPLIEAYGSQTGYHAAASNAVVLVSHDSQVNGWYVEDTGSPYSTFTNESGAAKWVVVTGATSVRSFTLEVDEATLREGDDHLDDDSLDEFTINFSASTSDPFWRVQVGESGGTLAINVTRNDLSAPGVVHVGTCTAPSTTALTVNFTAATAGGEYCEPLAKLWSGSRKLGSTGYFNGDTYQIKIANGDEAAGAYEFITDGDPDTGNTEGDGERSGTEPWRNEAIYAATVEYSYNASSLGYTSEIRVAPGEPDE